MYKCALRGFFALLKTKTNATIIPAVLETFLGFKIMGLTLEQKQAKLKAELAKITERLTKEARKKDARQKILIGAFILTKYKNPAQDLAGFSEYLTKDQDRELFGLAPLAKRADSKDSPTDSQN